MKKTLVVLGSSLILFLGLVTYAQAAILYVDCATGDNANPGTDIAAPKLTIKAAVTAAISDDTIEVAAGTCSFTSGTDIVTIDKTSLTIKGAQADGTSTAPTILSAPADGTVGSFFETNSSSDTANIRGFIMHGADRGVLIYNGTTGLTVEKNVFIGGTYNALTVASGGSVDMTIQNNVFYNQVYAIGIGGGVTGVTAAIQDNIFSENTIGIFDQGSGNALASDHNVFFNVATTHNGATRDDSDSVNNPHFVNAANNDFRLYDTSPLLGAGSSWGLNIGWYQGAGVANSVYQATCYVDPVNGVDNASHCSSAAPFKTITYGLLYTTGTLILKDGTYSATNGETLPLNVSTDSLTVTSANGPQTTIIDGENAFISPGGIAPTYMLLISSSNATVSSLQLVNFSGTGSIDEGIVVEGSSGTVEHCYFNGLADGDQTAAVLVSASGAVVKNNLVLNTYYGIGTALTASGTIGSGTGNSINFLNNTLIGNTYGLSNISAQGGPVAVVTIITADYKNNIISTGTYGLATILIGPVTATFNITADYNLYYGLTGSIYSGSGITDSGHDGQASIDPQFTSGPYGGSTFNAYYLTQTGPAVNAGSDTAVNLGLDGRTTHPDEYLDSSTVDLGYHYPSTNHEPAPTIPNPPSGDKSGNIPIYYTLVDEDSDPLDITVEFHNGTAWQTCTEATTDTRSEGIQDLTSSSAGVEHTFIWASATDLNNSQLGSTSIRITATDGLSTHVVTTASALNVNNLIPTITSVSPSAITNGQANTVTITGTNYVSGATVSLIDSGSQSTSLTATFVSSTSLTAVVASTQVAGIYDVKVTNPNTNSITSADVLTVADPVVTPPVVVTPVIHRQHILTAPNATGAPQIVIYNGAGQQQKSFMAYTSSYRGSWFVTAGDINGDGVDEIITAPGPGFAPQVRVFDQAGTKLYEFYAYATTFRGGVTVASSDVDNDGKDEIVTLPYSQGGSNCRIFGLRDTSIIPTTLNFFIFPQALRGGFSLAMPDFEGDGLHEIVVAPLSKGSAHLQIFGYRASTRSYRAVILGLKVYAESFHGGVTLAAGDIDGDSKDEVITGIYSAGGPHVMILQHRASDGQLHKLNPGFYAYARAFHGGVSVATADTDKDGKAEIVTATRTKAKPYVTRFLGTTQTKLKEFYAYPETFIGGVNLGAVKVD